MSDLAEWLLEQIAADAEWLLEQIAADEARIGTEDPNGLGYDYCDSTLGVHLTIEEARADVTAKRRILARYELTLSDDQLAILHPDAHGIETAVHMLAQSYADRPGFDPAWRKEAGIDE